MRSGGISSKNLLSQLIKIKEDEKIARKYKLPFYTFNEEIYKIKAIFMILISILFNFYE